MPQGDSAESTNVVLELPGTGIRFDTWKSYSFHESYLEPSSSFSVTLGDETISNKLQAAVAPGKVIQLTINGKIQATCIVDRVCGRRSRGGGTDISIEGRDFLSPAIDGNPDPFTTQFPASSTLFDVIAGTFGPFGISAYSVDNDVNKNVITGQVRGQPSSKKGRPLKSFTIHQLKAEPNESAYQFASRITQRFGLWIRPSSDGASIVICKPEFEQTSRYRLVHKRGAPGTSNNIINVDWSRDGQEQPSAIVATGFSTGGEQNRSKIKAIAVNELAVEAGSGFTNPRLATLVKTHKDAKQVPFRNTFGAGIGYPALPIRTMFMHDQESKTIDELTHFVQRELSLRQRKAFTYHATVEGHMNNAQPWCVDTICDVDDDYAQVHGPLWVLSRRFYKDRSSNGTRTDLEMILPGTLVF